MVKKQYNPKGLKLGRRYWKGKHLSEDHKRKISESEKGKFVSEETKKKIREARKRQGSNVWNKGRRGLQVAWNKGKKCPSISKARRGMKFSEEHRRRLSESHKGYKMTERARKKIGRYMTENRRGQDNPNWKGGITSNNRRIRHQIEFRQWRDEVFKRDNWTCQKYKIKGGELHPHHIKNFSQFPELRFAVDNGITFSVRAHNEFHKKYGRKNNTKEQLEEFLGAT